MWKGHSSACQDREMGCHPWSGLCFKDSFQKQGSLTFALTQPWTQGNWKEEKGVLFSSVTGNQYPLWGASCQFLLIPFCLSSSPHSHCAHTFLWGSSADPSPKLPLQCSGELSTVKFPVYPGPLTSPASLLVVIVCQGSWFYCKEQGWIKAPPFSSGLASLTFQQQALHALLSSPAHSVGTPLDEVESGKARSSRCECQHLSKVMLLLAPVVLLRRVKSTGSVQSWAQWSRFSGSHLVPLGATELSTFWGQIILVGLAVGVQRTSTSGKPFSSS